MQLGVSSYSFSRLVQSGAINQLDVIQLVKNIGFEVIEFSALSLPEGETTLSFAPKIREACDEAGLPIVNYTVGADFINGSNEDWKAEVERVKDEVRVAQILGAPGMRHDATRGFPREFKGKKSFDDALPMLIPAIREVTDFAADLGVRTMVENHGFFCQDSDRVEKLVNGVDHENFGILIDMGNFLCVDEDPATAIGRLIPYAFHVHAKDFHVKTGTSPDPGKGWFNSRAGNYLSGAIIGHGEVPLLSCLSIMKKHEYDGVLSIEFEGLEHPSVGLRIGFSNLKRYLSLA